MNQDSRNTMAYLGMAIALGAFGPVRMGGAGNTQIKRGETPQHSELRKRRKKARKARRKNR